MADDSPKLATILRALQERHLVVEQKKAMTEIYFLQMQSLDEFLTPPDWDSLLSQTSLTPIDWDVSLPVSPSDANVSGLSLQDRVTVLAQAVREFDRIKQHYLNYDPEIFAAINAGNPQGNELVPKVKPTQTFTERDMPSLGRVTPHNLLQVQRLLAEDLHQLKVLAWPLLNYSTSAALYEFYGNDYSIPPSADLTYPWTFVGGISEGDYALFSTTLTTAEQSERMYTSSPALVPPAYEIDILPAITPGTDFQQMLLDYLQNSPFGVLDHRTRGEDRVAVHSRLWADSDTAEFTIFGVPEPVMYQRHYLFGTATLFQGVTGEGEDFPLSTGSSHTGLAGTLHLVSETKSRMHVYNQNDQSEVTVPEEWVEHQANTPDGNLVYEGIMDNESWRADPLTLPASGTLRIRLGNTDNSFDWPAGQWDILPQFNPAFSTYSPPVVAENAAENHDWDNVFWSEYVAFGVFEPGFAELTSPLATQTQGSGTTGMDYPVTAPESPSLLLLPLEGWGFHLLNETFDTEPAAYSHALYSIELGDGKTSRGNQGTLTAHYNGDAFELRFYGKRLEYDLPEFSEDQIVYTGGLVETTVAYQIPAEIGAAPTGITVTQKLSVDLPDNLGSEGDTLKVFTFAIQEDENDPHTTLTCEYLASGRPTVTRHWVLTPGDVYAGPSRSGSKRYTIRSATDTHSLADDMWTFTHHLDGGVVAEQDVEFALFERYGSHGIPSSITERSLEAGTPDRATSLLHHDNGLPQQIGWTGPDARTVVFDANGTPASGTDGLGPFSSTATLAGNTFTQTSRHGSHSLETTEWTWIAEGEATLEETLPSDGTQTSITFWSPADAPPGQIPWGIRRIDYEDGTSRTMRDIRAANERTVTVFQGTVNAGGAEIEGLRTVTVYNRLGAVKRHTVTWQPDGLVLSDDQYTQSRVGPTQHTATDGFVSTAQWNGAGELLQYTGRRNAFTLAPRDVLGRLTQMTDTLTGVATTFTPDGNQLGVSAASGGNTHAATRHWNTFGETETSSFTGPQNQGGTLDWSGGVWSGTADNLHTHAGVTRSFNESSLESLIRSKTGPGRRTAIAYEALGGTPCLRIDTFAVQPGLTGGVEKPVSKTFVDGLGRVQRESAPDPSEDDLVWLNTDYTFDSEGRLERIDLPAEPDLLFTYDGLSRPYRRAVDLNHNGEVDLGVDAVFETTYDVVNGKWVEETGVWIKDENDVNVKRTLSKAQSDALTRTFTRQVGSRADDTLVSTTPAAGQERVTLNGRVVFESSPTTATATDNSNGETQALAKVVSSSSPLGVPMDLTVHDGPETRALEFDGAAQLETLTDAGIVSTFGHSYNPDASSTHDTDYGAQEGPTVSLDPGASTTDVGGGGGMPHVTGLDWSPTHGWKQTLSLAGGNQSEWHINPAGRVTKKVFANDDETLFTHDAAGRLTAESTPAGTQSWVYDPQTGFLKKWSVGGVDQFDITDHDVLGRPREIVDDSGTREIRYDDLLWAPDTVEWTAGPLQGFKLDEDADARGRLGVLSVSKSGAALYSVTHAYRGESDRIDTMTLTVPGIASPILIDVNGDGGVADELVYSFGGQPVFTYSRARDGNGRLNGITAPGFSQSWTPDAMGRVHQLTTNGETTTYGYDPDNGTLASAVSPDTTRLYAFNDRGELVEEQLDGEPFLATPSPDQSGGIAGRENPRDLTLFGSVHTNAVAEILVGTNLVHSTTNTPFSYTFDETTLPALADPNAVVSFDWSVVGTLPGVEYEGGQAVAKVRGYHRFAPRNEPVQYDSAARRSTDAFLTYGWNAANQVLMLEELHGPHRTEHDYDGSQRRVEKRVYHNGNLQRTHRFVYDGWLPVVEEVTDQWGNLDYRNLYVWGPGPDGVRRPGLGATGQLALIIHQPKQGPPQLSAPVYNHRLDLVALIDVETGNVVARYGYTPFGETTYAIGPRADQNPFRFAGAYYDAEVNLYAFGYRYYDPRTKSWLSRDPIGEAGGLNLFSYCDADPVNKGPDYLGLYTVEGMISEFGTLYGDNPNAMLALMLVMSRYEVVQGGQWVRDWSVDHATGQIAINANNITPFTARSDRNAAKQMYQVLADEFYEVSNLPETWGGAFRRRGGGSLQMVGGGVSVVGGGALLAVPEPTMLTKVGGVGAIAVGGNEFVDGAARTFGGRGSSFNMLDMAARSYGGWVAGDAGADQASFYMGISRFAFGSAGAFGNSTMAQLPLRQLPGAVRSELSVIADKFFGQKIYGMYGHVTRRALLDAAADTGDGYHVVTRLSGSPQAGRSLSVAVGDGAGALAAADRGGRLMFAGRIPKALIIRMREAGLVRVSTTMQAGVTGTEFQFAPGATEFILQFLKQVP